ncbi:MAG: hypothetical protein J6S13_07780 [Clostridia bacterium]|nr:hypothetical protein [Clostridia bacterium]
MKTALKKGMLYIFYLLFSIWFGMAVEILLIYPIEIIFEPDALTETVLRSCLMTFGSMIAVTLVSAIEGHRNKRFDFKTMLSGAAVMICVHQILSFLWPALYVMGWAIEWADIPYVIETGYGYDRRDPPFAMLHIITLCLDVVAFSPLLWLGEVLGVKHHTKSLEKAKGGAK